MQRRHAWSDAEASDMSPFLKKKVQPNYLESDALHALSKINPVVVFIGGTEDIPEVRVQLIRV
jgi:hypothetical protein